MKNSKALMKVAGVYPKLKLGEIREGTNGKVSVHPTGPHRVKMVEDKVTKGIDKETRQPIEVVKYVVEEEGVLKQYVVPVKSRETGELHYLVQRLSEVEEGQEIIIEMKKQGPKNYVGVLNSDGTPLGVGEEGETQISEDEVDDVFDKLEESNTN
jgi:hypothetical protein